MASATENLGASIGNLEGCARFRFPPQQHAIYGSIGSKETRSTNRLRSYQATTGESLGSLVYYCGTTGLLDWYFDLAHCWAVVSVQYTNFGNFCTLVDYWRHFRVHDESVGWTTRKSDCDWWSCGNTGGKPVYGLLGLARVRRFRTLCSAMLRVFRASRRSAFPRECDHQIDPQAKAAD